MTFWQVDPTTHADGMSSGIRASILAAISFRVKQNRVVAFPSPRCICLKMLRVSLRSFRKASNAFDPSGVLAFFVNIHLSCLFTFCNPLDPFGFDRVMFVELTGGSALQKGCRITTYFKDSLYKYLGVVLITLAMGVAMI